MKATEDPGPQRLPDAILRPDGPLVTDFEVERGIVMPSTQYAMIDSAYAHAAGWTVDDHRGRLGGLWSHFAEVAASDPLAWDRSAPDALAIIEPSTANRMVAFPYTRMLCSQWNVDQAAAIVLVGASVARELGIDEDRWVYPVATAESNAMIPMPQRRDVYRWPAFRVAAKRLFALAGCTLGDVDALELYSCFPSAVLVQLNELALSTDRPLTVTGGMTFAGGPLNNFVLQATVAMIERIREGDVSTGLVTGVSGLLTKPGLALWSRTPPPGGFAAADVTDEALRTTPTHPMAMEETGDAAVVAATVAYERGAAPRAVAVVELADGSRTVSSSEHGDDVAAFMDADPVGRRVRLVDAGRFRS